MEIHRDLIEDAKWKNRRDHRRSQEGFVEGMKSVKTILLEQSTTGLVMYRLKLNLDLRHTKILLQCQGYLFKKKLHNGTMRAATFWFNGWANFLGFF